MSEKRILTGAIESSAFEREIETSIANGWRVVSDSQSTGWIDGTGNTRTVVLVRESEGE